MLSDSEKAFVSEAQKLNGLPSTIKECIFLARLTSKEPLEILRIKQDVSASVNEEYPKL